MRRPLWTQAAPLIPQIAREERPLSRSSSAFAKELFVPYNRIKQKNNNTITEMKTNEKEIKCVEKLN